MAKCLYCGSETGLCNGGVPICLKCSDERANKPKKPPAISKSIQTILIDEIVQATARVNRAYRDFLEVMGHIPTGFPHPDGSQRIHNASGELAKARKDLVRAHAALDDFLKTG